MDTNTRTPAEIWEGLSAGMRAYVMRGYGVPFGRETPSARACYRRRLVDRIPSPYSATAPLPTPLGRAVAEYGRKAGG